MEKKLTSGSVFEKYSCFFTSLPFYPICFKPLYGMAAPQPGL